MNKCPIAFLGYCPDIQCNPCYNPNRMKEGFHMEKIKIELTSEEMTVLQNALKSYQMHEMNKARTCKNVLDHLPNDTGTQQLYTQHTFNARFANDLFKKLIAAEF